MLAVLTIALAVGAALLAALGAVAFAFHRTRPRALDVGATVVETGFVLRALFGIGLIVSGRHSAGVTHIAYLVTSVVILPIALNSLGDDRTPWSSAVIAVASLALAVVAIRMQMTWSGDA